VYTTAELLFTALIASAMDSPPLGHIEPCAAKFQCFFAANTAKTTKVVLLYNALNPKDLMFDTLVEACLI